MLCPSSLQTRSKCLLPIDCKIYFRPPRCQHLFTFRKIKLARTERIVAPKALTYTTPSGITALDSRNILARIRTILIGLPSEHRRTFGMAFTVSNWMSIDAKLESGRRSKLDRSSGGTRCDFGRSEMQARIRNEFQDAAEKAVLREKSSRWLARSSTNQG